jgi:alpha-galactosidase
MPFMIVPDSMTLIRSERSLLLLSTVAGERPYILYWGALFEGFDPAELSLLATRQHYHGGPTEVVHPTLSGELGGWSGAPPGLVIQRQGMDWLPDLRVVRTEQTGEHTATICCTDSRCGVQVTHHLAIDSITDMLTASCVVENLRDEPLTVDWCAALCLPQDDRLNQVTGFSGKWAGEFSTEHHQLSTASYLRENRGGRTSHDNFPGLLASAAHTSERNGLCAGFHLGWSGNHRLRVDRLADGRVMLQMGELLLPGEIQLAAGERYETPVMFAATTNDGLSRLSQRFHRHLRSQVLDSRTADKPRPVHFNTWEAVYFNHSPEKLLQLAELAAEVGAERFVLDDGWFGGRRSDGAGLGDWTVSRDVYPEGLGPLADRVRDLGMEFGIWFEPEMINPDSDLYRAHPDWVLGIKGHETTPFRNQLALDLTKPEVFEYLFEAMDAIIREYRVDYIKWDMNRETLHPASGGRAAMHRQTRALYDLIARLRRAHPVLEIESCASGGARADYGILHHTDRIWTSDNNDARSRQAIQRGASHFFPLSVTGSHVGPATCHITRRTLPMAFRAATAMFGHMGMEVALAQERAADRATLARAIALYKQHRALLHSGDHYRIDTPDFLNAMGVISTEQSEALFSCALLDTHPAPLPPRLRLDGLDPGRKYRLLMIWPESHPSITAPSIIEAADLLADGRVFSGSALMQHGIQLPLLYPDTCIILHLQTDEAA